MVYVSPVLKYSIAFAFFLLALHHAFSQDQCSQTVEGWVLDLETKKPIPYVSIRVNGGTAGGFTDSEGYFRVSELCKEEFDLTVSHVGYKTSVHHHDIYHSSPTIMLAPDDQVLESVVVEGAYNPTNMNTISIDKLSDSEFRRSRSSSLGEMAGSISGLSVMTTGQNIVKPIIHGLHSNRVLIINNGVRHEFQNWGVAHAPEIDPSIAGSLDVVKGAATVRYGPDALGGVILIDPRKPELSSGLNGSVEGVANTNGKSGEVNLDMGYGWKNFVLAGQGSMVRQGDLHAPDYQLTNTGKQENSLAGAFRFHQSRFDLEGYYSRFDQNLGILRASVNGNLDDLRNAMESKVPPDTRPFSYSINTPRQEVVHHLMKLKSTYVWDNQDISVQYAYQLNHRREFDVRRGTNNEIPAINLQLASQSFDLDWNHPSVGPFEGALGFQWLYQDNDNIPGTNTIPFVPNFNNTRAGIYAIERLKSEHTTYEAGIRYDFQYSSVRGRAPNNDIYRNELTFSQLTGSLGMQKSIQNQLDFRTNLGMAWRPPNISELYSFGKHQASIAYGLWRYSRDESGNVAVDGVQDEADKSVRPEVGLKWINTLEGQENDMRWDITAYANLIKNYIYNRPAGITNTVRGAFPYFIYDQDDALFLGVDVAWDHAMTDVLQLEAKGSYIWAKDISNGDSFTEIPPAKVDAGLSFSAKPKWLAESIVSVQSAYVFRYFQQPRLITAQQIIEAKADDVGLFDNDNSNFDFMNAPDGYLLTNLSWTGARGDVSWTFQVKNLMDVQYRTNTNRLRYFADELGRNFQLSIRYAFR